VSRFMSSFTVYRFVNGSQCSANEVKPIYSTVVLLVIGWRSKVSHIARPPVLIESTVAFNANAQTRSDSVIL
jgi:hypothetical protein